MHAHGVVLEFAEPVPEVREILAWEVLLDAGQCPIQQSSKVLLVILDLLALFAGTTRNATAPSPAGRPALDHLVAHC